MVGGKVDGQILFGVRGEDRIFYLVPNDSYEKFYVAVKGLIYSKMIVLLLGCPTWSTLHSLSAISHA